ncbi:hypothetical protein IE993_11180 [Klebsiella pneumoniae]|nr:hypothetical protein [Klebsiella pneumoniae]
MTVAAGELIDHGSQRLPQKSVAGIDCDVYFFMALVPVNQHNAMLRSILRAYAVIVTVQIIYYWCRLSYFLREECLAENGNFCFLLSRI